MEREIQSVYVLAIGAMALAVSTILIHLIINHWLAIVIVLTSIFLVVGVTMKVARVFMTLIGSMETKEKISNPANTYDITEDIPEWSLYSDLISKLDKSQFFKSTNPEIEKLEFTRFNLLKEFSIIRDHISSFPLTIQLSSVFMKHSQMINSLNTLIDKNGTHDTPSNIEIYSRIIHEVGDINKNLLYVIENQKLELMNKEMDEAIEDKRVVESILVKKGLE